MLTDELLEKDLWIVETCLSVNNNSCGKLVLPLDSPNILGDNHNTTSVFFFVADFNLFS